MTDTATLIQRLEAATGPDRELDAEIHIHVHGWKLSTVPKDCDGKNDGETYTPGAKPIEGFVYPPRGKIGLYFHVPDGLMNQYTRNTDAALGLVPSPDWEIKSVPHRGGKFSATIFSSQINSPLVTHRGEAPTPALALTIAALRARGLS